MVWTKTSQGLIYPNLYVLLISPPGIGKSQAISRAYEFWASCPKLHVAPNSVTRASLLDELNEAVVREIHPKSSLPIIFNALTISASEFGVLCPSHDLEFLNTLNDIFDNPPRFKESRRSRSIKSLEIPEPTLNIIGGTQPGYLSHMLPEEAWSMGFTSRLIMVYSAQETHIDLFADPIAPPGPLRRDLAKDLETISHLFGEVSWTDEARSLIAAWQRARLAPVPTHSRLQHYNARRLLHVIKLSTIASISRGNDLQILPEDFIRAQDWLLKAETLMPDIFRDMAGKSDKNVIEDMHLYVWQLYARHHNKPVHKERIVRFLADRVPSEKVLRLFDLCVQSGVLERSAGTQDYYVPSALNRTVE